MLATCFCKHTLSLPYSIKIEQSLVRISSIPFKVKLYLSMCMLNFMLADVMCEFDSAMKLTT